MKKNFYKKLIAVLVASLIISIVPFYVGAEEENTEISPEPGGETDPTGGADPSEPTPEVIPEDPTPTNTPTHIISRPTFTPVPATATPTPTSAPVVSTPIPTPTIDPNITVTPTTTPYLTVVPPDPNRVFPQPNNLSDKQVNIKSPKVIKVDGIYDEMWEKVPAHNLDNIAWGKTGASGYFKTYWDKTNFYILVDVTDDTPDTESDRFTRQDCVELFFDETSLKPTEYGDGNYHIKINRDGLIEYGNNTNEFLAEAKVIPKEEGYIVEALFKFTTVVPVYGQAIGFDVRINDSQGDQYRDFMVQWSDTSMYTYTDLSKIGTIFLK